MRYARLRRPDCRSAVTHFARRLDHNPPKLHNRDVTGTEPFLAAVNGWSHGLPHRDVLIGEAYDAGEISELHRLAILPVIVLLRTQFAELLIQIDADLRTAEFAPSFLLDPRFVRLSPGDHVQDGIGVVDRNVHE